MSSGSSGCSSYLCILVGVGGGKLRESEREVFNINCSTIKYMTYFLHKTDAIYSNLTSAVSRYFCKQTETIYAEIKKTHLYYHFLREACYFGALGSHPAIHPILVSGKARIR